MSVDYTEMHGSPKEDFSVGSCTAIRILRCAYNSRWTLAIELLASGGATYENAGVPIYAKRVGMNPVPAEQQGSGTITSYEYAELIVEYGMREYETSELISESFEPGMEFITLDPEDFRWPDSGGVEGIDDSAHTLKDNEAPGRINFSGIYNLTFHGIPVLNMDLLNLMGTTNKFTISAPTLGLTFLPGTLLYTPPVTTPIIDENLDLAWRVDYSFSYMQTGWNRFWNQAGVKLDGSKGTFDYMYHKTDLNNPYFNHPPTDWSALGVVQL